MKAINGKTLDLNSLLMLANFAVICLTAYVFNANGPNDYIDLNTILLGAVLAVQTHITLFLEKRRRDPFVILLALTMIFYFSFRIFTLCLYPYSVVFQRAKFDVGDSNFALTFIIIANTFLYLGFYAVRLKTKDINTVNWVPHRASGVLAIIALSILFFYTKDIFWTSDNIPRVFRFFELFVSPSIVLLMGLAYYLLLRKLLTRWTALAIIALLVIDALLHTLAGSRSAIIEIVNNYIIVTLAVAGSVKVSRKISIAAVLLLPVVVALLMALFTFASLMRATKVGVTTPYFNVERAMELYGTPELKLSNFDEALPPLFDRIGFFDYSAEIIAHRDAYASVINIESYTKSIVDNLLTPGFDIFDQPKISNSLKFVYGNLGAPSKLEVMESYQSDQLGLYGEFYVLLGYASLPLFFVLAYLLKRIYLGLRNENPFNFVMKRTIVLYLFVRIINSFGIDWIIIDMLAFGFSIYLYKFLFQIKPNDEVSAPRFVARLSQ